MPSSEYGRDKGERRPAVGERIAGEMGSAARCMAYDTRILISGLHALFDMNRRGTLLLRLLLLLRDISCRRKYE